MLHRYPETKSIIFQEEFVDSRRKISRPLRLYDLSVGSQVQTICTCERSTNIKIR